MPDAGNPRIMFRLSWPEYETLVAVASAAGMGANEFARVLVLAVNEESRTGGDPSGPNQAQGLRIAAPATSPLQRLRDRSQSRLGPSQA